MGRVLEVIRGEKLKSIREEIESFCDEIMGEYLQECEGTCKTIVLSPFDTKNFYDSVWGTIEINRGEVFILDSPILQRLRYIKQLGLADLLYSSANHSRFSHTLGVVQTADVMQRQIEKELTKKNFKTDENVNQIVRLSAIFHDCGHMFCSHASERFFQKKTTYSRFKEIDSAREEFNRRLEIKPSLSEIISISIVQSPAVKKLISIVEAGLVNMDFNNGKADEVIEKICCFILGFPYSEKLLPYSQIISGQIDSDKLDYLKRDSHSTGVPSAVDMSRVFQKLRVVETKRPFSMKSTSNEDVEARYTLAIAPAAINTVDQLIVSRYMMFENVYFHQKTLTAEELLRYAMGKLDASTKGLLDNFRTILLLKDCDVIHCDFEAAVRNYVEDFSIIDYEEFQAACSILNNLYKRKLFKRSVAFTSENMADVGHKGSDFYSRLFKTRDSAAQEKFVLEVKEKTIELKKLLLGSSPYNYNKDTDILLIIAPDISNISLNSNLAIAEKNNKYRDMEFEADNWLKSRSTRKPQNYLVTYSQDRYLVFLATEYVLLKTYGLMISDSIIYDEKDRKQIEEIRGLLAKRGFYKDAFALIPNTEINIYNRDIHQLISDKWKKYELISEDNGFAKTMDVTYLVMFLKQFYQFERELGNYDVFVRACVEMLKNVRIISKQEIFNALKKNFAEIAKREECGFDRLKVCNIGNVQDSGAQIAYQVNSINEAFRTKMRVQSLEEALKFSEENQVIVFVDDAFCTGKQIISIFETYMGIPLEDRQTKEEHVKELTDEEKEKLKKSKLYFSFIFYNKENEVAFLQRLKEIGLNNVCLLAKEEFPLGYFTDTEPEDSESPKAILKQYLTMAGKMLIEQKAVDEQGNRKENRSDERMRNSTLGYENAQQLIVFAWNTPTYTLTPLWLQGKKKGYEWYPLFPRIDK